jgi:hypothetical protein
LPLISRNTVPYLCPLRVDASSTPSRLSEFHSLFRQASLTRVRIRC